MILPIWQALSGYQAVWRSVVVFVEMWRSEFSRRSLQNCAWLVMVISSNPNELHEQFSSKALKRCQRFNFYADTVISGYNFLVSSIIQRDFRQRFNIQDASSLNTVIISRCSMTSVTAICWNFERRARKNSREIRLIFGGIMESR